MPNFLRAHSEKDDIAMLTLAQTPYGFTSTTGKTVGVLYDILNEIMVESGIGMYNAIAPSKRIYSYVERNKKFCSLFAGTPDALLNFTAIEPIGYEIDVGVLPRAGIDLSSYAQLEGIAVAVTYGVEFDKRFDADDSLSKVYPRTYLNGIRLFKAGRVDALAGSIPNILYSARQENVSRNDFDAPLIIKKLNIELFCTKDLDDKIRHRLQKAVKKLKSRGKIRSIINRYFDSLDY